MQDPVKLFSRYAQVCREVQRKAIELENQPDRRKTLRRFAAREVADQLDISQSHLRNLVRTEGFPEGKTSGNGRRSFSIEEIHEARRWLHKTTGSSKYAPRRDPVGEKLQVVTFVNFKGGSAKTTSATHFAQYMALNGYRVLLIDLDPQASATALFGFAPETDVDEDVTFAGWLRRDEQDRNALGKAVVQKTYWPNLDLLPSSISLQHAEYDLMGRLLQDKRFQFYAQLQAFIDQVGDDYDLVVCDCRPDVGMMTINALISATALVIPIPPSMIDFASSGEFFRFMSEVADDMRSSLGDTIMRYDFVRILTTKYRPTDRNQAEIVSWQQAFFQDAVLPAPMIETAVIDAAGLLKETLYEYEPSGSRRSYERGYTAMNAVNSALESEVVKAWGRNRGRRKDAA